jgi:phosphatidylethanolamine/phosphatidyl-N-methylethanolamine N-methyltransferase
VSGARSNWTATADELTGFGNKLFIRRWLAHPLKVGSVAPSGKGLSRLLARQAKLLPDHAVIEVGAGTGPVTQALLDFGIPAEKLLVVEIDRDMCRFLQAKFPQLSIVEGDCRRLAEIIPDKWRGKVSTLISGIPMVSCPFEVQKQMLDSYFEMLRPGGKVVQVTFSLFSPLPIDRHKLKARRVGVAPLNFPPAWVWSYERQAA